MNDFPAILDGLDRETMACPAAIFGVPALLGSTPCGYNP
jgi:hypothetical protein